MVDLETSGLDPTHSAILQIAAVRFNYETGEIGPTYEACLAIPDNRFWDEGTREWWLNQNQDVLSDILTRAGDPQETFRHFIAWCHETGPAVIEQRLWAKPIHFEWPFLQSYARQYERTMPFHYRNAVDLNSFTRGLTNNPGARSLDKAVEFVGNAHNALDDTLHQVKVALMARSLTCEST